MATVDPIRRCAQTRPRSIPSPPQGTCSLRLIIRGQTYKVRPVACDPSVAIKCYRLRKADGTTYHVALTPHGLACECPDFTWKREGLDPAGCKHVRSLVALGLLNHDPRPRSQSAAKASGRSRTGLIPSDVAEEIARTTLVGHQP